MLADLVFSCEAPALLQLEAVPATIQELWERIVVAAGLTLDWKILEQIGFFCGSLRLFSWARAALACKPCPNPISAAEVAPPKLALNDVYCNRSSMILTL